MRDEGRDMKQETRGDRDDHSFRSLARRIRDEKNK